MAPPLVVIIVRHVPIELEIVPAGRERALVGKQAGRGQQLAHFSGMDERIPVLPDR